RTSRRSQVPASAAGDVHQCAGSSTARETPALRITVRRPETRAASHDPILDRRGRRETLGPCPPSAETCPISAVLRDTCRPSCVRQARGCACQTRYPIQTRGEGPSVSDGLRKRIAWERALDSGPACTGIAVDGYSGFRMVALAARLGRSGEPPACTFGGS